VSTVVADIAEKLGFGQGDADESFGTSVQSDHGHPRI
jgi:hypothetical protein